MFTSVTRIVTPYSTSIFILFNFIYFIVKVMSCILIQSIKSQQLFFECLKKKKDLGSNLQFPAFINNEKEYLFLRSYLPMVARF